MRYGHARWKSLISLLFPLVVSVRSAAGQAPVDVVRTDDATIYALALNAVAGPQWARSSTKIVLFTPTAPEKRSSRANDAEEYNRLNGVDTSAIHDANSRSRASISLTPLRDSIAAHLSVKLDFATAADMAYLRRHQGKQSLQQAFTTRFPGSTALVHVSAIGYNRAGDQAVVSVWQDCFGLCGIGHVLRLQRVGRRWTVAETNMTAQS